jgi:hypothetical protein
MSKQQIWLGAMSLACSVLLSQTAKAELSACAPLTPSARSYVKFQPGYYVALGSVKWNNDPLPDTLEEIKSIPGVVGVQKRYFWSDIQTGRYTYNFDRMKADIAAVKAKGKKISIFINWKFKTDQGNNPTPAYLSNLTSAPTYYKMGGANTGPNAQGFTTALNNPVVANEFIRFLGKLKAVVDDDPAVSTVTFVESALGIDFSNMTTTQANTIKKNFWDQLLRIDKEASCLFKHTPVLQLTNAPASQFDNITQDFMKWGIAFGGPDVWLDDPALLTYPYYPTVAKESPIGVIVAGGNFLWYSHDDEVAQESAKEIPYDATTTVKMLANKARNELYSNYVFWKRNWGGDEYYTAFINEAKKLNTASQTIQPLYSGCPGYYQGICRIVKPF